MSVIQPDKSLILVTGINSKTFLTGYNPKDRSFDKSQTPMGRQSLYAMALSPNRAQAVFYERKPICFVTDWEALEDGIPYHDELSLDDTAHFAYRWTERHGGSILLLMMKHPELRIDGIDYRIEERRGDYVINPGKVKLKKIMRATDVKLDKRGMKLESITLEDVTVTIGVSSF